MKHPGNKQEFAKGSIMEQMGFTCNITFEDESNLGQAYLFEQEHGECEFHYFIK